MLVNKLDNPIKFLSKLPKLPISDESNVIQSFSNRIVEKLEADGHILFDRCLKEPYNVSLRLSPLEAVSFTYSRPEIIKETDLKVLDSRFLNPVSNPSSNLESFEDAEDIESEHNDIKEKENVGNVLLKRLSMEVEGVVEENVDQGGPPELSDFKTVDNLRDLSTKQIGEILIMNKVYYDGFMKRKQLLDIVERLWKQQAGLFDEPAPSLTQSLQLGASVQSLHLDARQRSSIASKLPESLSEPINVLETVEKDNESEVAMLVSKLADEIIRRLRMRH